MNRVWRALLTVLLALGADARAQQAQRDPHIAYGYPAGGRQGRTFRVTVGGQALRGVTGASITGAGVRARFVEHFPPVRNLTSEQREALAEAMRSAIAKRWDEMRDEAGLSAQPPWRELGLPPRLSRNAAKDAIDPEEYKLPPHPLYYDLESKSLRELLHVRDVLLTQRGAQPNPQLAESVMLEVTIDPNATIGDRELRLVGRSGLSNPIVFEVGAMPEAAELESNDPGAATFLPPEPPLELPVVIDGQILSGDVDGFRFQARKGQKIVVDVDARRLIPFLADAVPGWFQATVAVYDAKGDEVAYADDYRFEPDPALMFEAPADGAYQLEIRDSLYRGRQDFVYRIVVGELPYITSIFPLGNTKNRGRSIAVEGWNVAAKSLFLKTESEAEGVHRQRLAYAKRETNPVEYAIDDVPTHNETEDNNTTSGAQHVAMPQIVNGRIQPAGDADVFRIHGDAGEEIVVEVVARQLGSPLDSLLRVFDSTGNVVAWNDDYEQTSGMLHTSAGLLTHSADSYVRAYLPQHGEYYVQVSDSQEQGGPEYAYRLRVSRPRPDFSLRVTPSSVNISAGGVAPIRVFALRKDGFSGEIDLQLKDAPAGFKLSGARIPAGRDQVRLTIAAPRQRADSPLTMHLEGRARIDGRTISREAAPADDMMQAFLYRHLVPAQTFMLAVLRSQSSAADVTISGESPVRIPVGGTQNVRLNVPASVKDSKVELSLSEPPPGVTMEQVERTDGVVTLVLKADAALSQVGFADNLIVEAFMELERPQRGGKGQKQRSSVGFLPAIPIEIVPATAAAKCRARPGMGFLDGPILRNGLQSLRRFQTESAEWSFLIFHAAPPLPECRSRDFREAAASASIICSFARRRRRASRRNWIGLGGDTPTRFMR
ncbi:MAG: PPC domain-containing protein [Planctomycetes bacterium]|nr:PPC domain-containing protein [Planctomycetota bacterium]